MLTQHVDQPDRQPQSFARNLFVYTPWVIRPNLGKFPSGGFPTSHAYALQTDAVGPRAFACCHLCLPAPITALLYSQGRKLHVSTAVVEQSPCMKACALSTGCYEGVTSPHCRGDAAPPHNHQDPTRQIRPRAPLPAWLPPRTFPPKYHPKHASLPAPRAPPGAPPALSGPAATPCSPHLHAAPHIHAASRPRQPCRAQAGASRFPATSPSPAPSAPPRARGPARRSPAGRRRAGGGQGGVGARGEGRGGRGGGGALQLELVLWARAARRWPCSTLRSTSACAESRLSTLRCTSDCAERRRSRRPWARAARRWPFSTLGSTSVCPSASHSVLYAGHQLARSWGSGRLWARAAPRWPLSTSRSTPVCAESRLST